MFADFNFVGNRLHDARLLPGTEIEETLQI
jgi:hypothetical protein